MLQFNIFYYKLNRRLEIAFVCATLNNILIFLGNKLLINTLYCLTTAPGTILAFIKWFQIFFFMFLQFKLFMLENFVNAKAPKCAKIHWIDHSVKYISNSWTILRKPWTFANESYEWVSYNYFSSICYEHPSYQVT